MKKKEIDVSESYNIIRAGYGDEFLPYAIFMIDKIMEDYFKEEERTDDLLDKIFDTVMNAKHIDEKTEIYKFYNETIQKTDYRFSQSYKIHEETENFIIKGFINIDEVELYNDHAVKWLYEDLVDYRNYGLEKEPIRSCEDKEKQDYWYVEFNETGPDLPSFQGEILTKELLDQFRQIDDDYWKINHGNGLDEFGSPNEQFVGYSKFYFNHVVEGQTTEHGRIDIGTGSFNNKEVWIEIYNEIGISLTEEDFPDDPYIITNDNVSQIVADKYFNSALETFKNIDHYRINNDQSHIKKKDVIDTIKQYKYGIFNILERVGFTIDNSSKLIITDYLEKRFFECFDELTKDNKLETYKKNKEPIRSSENGMEKEEIIYHTTPSRSR